MTDSIPSTFVVAADFCRQGCYWDCEHRAAAAAALERMHLHPVEHATGRPLQRCDECGDYFYDTSEHAREHQRMRQLGWLRE